VNVFFFSRVFISGVVVVRNNTGRKTNIRNIHREGGIQWYENYHPFT
jgi:hypothetical protein